MKQDHSTPLPPAFSGLDTVERLKAEIDLLTRGTRDTVYRLRYDTMRYDYISPAVEQLLGYSAAALETINMRSLILETRIVGNGIERVESYAGLEENRKRGEVAKWQADYRMKTRYGQEIWVSDISYPWFGEDGAIIGSIGSLRDITDRIDAEARTRDTLLHLPTHDAASGLIHPQVFWERLEHEILRLGRTHGDLSLMLIQLSPTGSASGTPLSDVACLHAAGILKHALRGLDGIARMHNGVFGVILPETDRDGALLLADRVLVTLPLQMPPGENGAPYNWSIGLASQQSVPALAAAEFYKKADIQLYIATRAGENQISADDTDEEIVH
jgi:diguanylate cyclase (GGDEF)-like protein/PAS domain S-box-containing protein